MQSQSSVHESDSDASTEEDSSTDDELDEFGFPRPNLAAPSTEEGPLVLMENWDGQFVLVQPRQERNRRRGSRGSRTNASIGESTVLSGTDQQALIIDADADDASSSEWSGVSDEDGGDTTDSMAEEDMPMLDSPALDMIIEEMGMSNGLSSAPTHSAPTEMPTPNIVVTDPSGTPTLTTPAMQTPSHPTPIVVVGEPSTPAPMPAMGTFHPTTDDPAQHAVIDGSKIPTKSPFTHGRRSRRGRASSVSTTNTNGTERKRKSSNGQQVVLPPFADPFFPTTLPKRARYSSIPGHPRFLAAKRQQEQDRVAMLEGMEETSDEAEIGLDLEDMLDEEMLIQETVNAHAHSHNSHGFRFDRVPVSTYLRRNFGSGRRQDEINAHLAYSSPVQQRTSAPSMQLAYENMGPGYTPMDGMGLGMGPLGYAVGAEGWGLEDTLAGPPARMMLVSPTFPPVVETGEGNANALSRKEKRRRKRIGGGTQSQGVSMVMEAVPPLQL